MWYWLTIAALIVLMLAHSTYLHAQPQPLWCESGTPMTIDGKPICAVIEVVEYDWPLPECAAMWHEACA